MRSLLFSYGRDPSGSLFLSRPDSEVRHPPTRPLPDLLMQTGAFTLRGCPHSALSVKTPPNLVQDSGAFPVRS